MSQSISVNSMSCQTSCSWANLPPDLLLSIADSLDVTTSIRLSIVCTSWASTLRPCLPSYPPMSRDQPIPWLLCSARNSHTNPNCSVLTFYDLNTAAYFSVRIPIPSLCGHQWLGSYEGWLVTLDWQLQLHLIKPLTGAHVLLPSNGIEKEHPRKVVLCQSPDNNNELQAFCLTHHGGLVSAKLGDESWTWIINDGTAYQDIIVHQGKVYALSAHVLCYYNLRSSCIVRTHIVSGPSLWWTNYLLEWNGELVMLMIDYKQGVLSLENDPPKRVTLYKTNKHGDHGCSTTRGLSLGDDALFFGASCSYVVSSSGRDDDIRGNCIYFTNQMSRCSHDAETSHLNHNFGCFDLGKQTYYKPCCPQYSPMHLPPPIWFWPC